MKGKKKEVKHFDKRNAYQSGDFVFQNGLPLAKEMFFGQCFTCSKKLVLVNKDECQFSQCLDLAYLC
jgi:hypothetical protein